MSKLFQGNGNLTRTDVSKVFCNMDDSATQHNLYQARHIGYEYNAPGYYFERENGTTYLLAYTKSGHATLEVGGKRYDLIPGSLLFLSLEEKSKLKAMDSHWEIYFLHAFGPEIGSFYRTFTRNRGHLIEQFSETIFVDCINQIYDAYQAKVRDYFTISALIYQLLMDVLRQSQPAEYTTVVAKALAYIDLHYAEKFDENDLARHVLVSKYFFIRQFHEQTGLTPKQYLTKLRIRKARFLLIQSKLTIAEIAAQTGFETAKNIYYAFTTELGVSPKEFRQLTRERVAPRDDTKT